MKVIVYIPPQLSVSLERESAIDADQFKQLQTTVSNLSQGFTNLSQQFQAHLQNHPTNDGIASAIAAAVKPVSDEVATLKQVANPIICAGRFAVDGTIGQYEQLGLPFTWVKTSPDEVTITHNYGKSGYGVVGIVGTYDQAIDISAAGAVMQVHTDNQFSLVSPNIQNFATTTINFIMYRTT